MNKILQSAGTEKVLSFTVLGAPVPWCVYTKRGARPENHILMAAWQTQIQAAAIDAMIQQFGRRQILTDRPVRLTMRFFRVPPLAALGPAKIARALIQRPDLTNYVKACEDAMKGVVYQDDSQVVEFLASKEFSENTAYTTILVENILAEEGK